MTFDIPEDTYGDDIAKFLKTNTEFMRIFPDKEQRDVLIAIVARFAFMHEFHEYEDKNPHDDTIGTEFRNLDAKLRNHRHQLDKNFSSKPEF